MSYEVDKYAELYKKRNKYKVKKKYIFILLAIVAIVTNPGQERHQKAVKEKFESFIGSNTGTPLSIIGNPLIDQTIMTSVNSTNYLFFSTTNIAWDGNSHTVGFGLFGMVFISRNVDDFLYKKYNS